MVVPIDFGKLYLEIEDPVTVTLRKRTGENTYTEFEIGYVLKRASDDTPFDTLNISLPGTTTTFHFWRIPLDNAEEGLTPEELDQIVSSGVTYTIISKKVHNRGHRYRCVASENVPNT